MSILDFFKRLSFLGFEDDFIEDPGEKAVAEAPRIRGQVVSDPGVVLRQHFSDEENLHLTSKIHEPLGDPDDIIFFPTPPFRK